MPGPFPGMDPYLESSSEWRDVHEGLITYMRDELNQLLPHSFRAKIDERLYVMPDDRSISPDIAVVSRPIQKSGTASAVLEAPDAPVKIAMLSDYEVRESYIEIVSLSNMERPVTIIELLSPTNKTPGAGRNSYIAKQTATIKSSTHLVEIDLLRSGMDTAAASRGSVGGVDYLAVLHRAGVDDNLDAWPWTVRQRMPKIAVPLSAGELDITLDLQKVFDRNYDAGAYVRFVNYNVSPDPPFSPEDQDWAFALLREKGVRQA